MFVYSEDKEEQIYNQICYWEKTIELFLLSQNFTYYFKAGKKWVIHYEEHIELNKSYQNESFDKFKLDKNEGNPYRDHCDGSSPERE